MDSPAIDFAAMLAKARREACARRGQQQQQQITERQDEQEGQQLRLHHEREGEPQQERHAQHVELQGRTHSEGAEQASQQPTLRRQQEQRQHDELLGVGQQQQQRPPRPTQETTSPSDGEGWMDASHAVRRLQAVGVQEVYNELQRHNVGMGKPVLLVDLQKPSDFERKHIRQAVSVHELLQQDTLLQRLQQQRPQLLLVYGSSYEEDESFQQLMQHKSAVAATARELSSGGGAAVQREPEGADAAAASLLLQQLIKALQEPPPSHSADTVQQEGHTPQEAQQQQQRERQQRMPFLVNRSEDLTCTGGKGVTAWLRGGLAAFAAAFPFLCVSSSTEKEAAAAPTATNSVAFMSYPLLVHCNFPALHATADAAAAGASVGAAASGPDGATKALQVTDTVVPCHAAAPDRAPATTTEACSSAAAAATEAGPASGPSVVDVVGENVSAVHGLYVGTPLHAASKAVRRRLGIGWIIDLTCSDPPPRSSRSNCCSRLNSTSSDGSTLNSRISGRGGGSASVRSITSSEGVNGEAQDVQVLRPLMSLATKAAVRSFLGCGFDSDDGGESFPALPHWSESTPERQRELAVAAGKYLLPLSECVELLKHIFITGRRRSGALEPSAAFVGDDAECVSGCSSVTQGKNTWKSSNSSARSGAADSGISRATSEDTRVEAEWLGEEKDRTVATAKTAFWEVGGSSCRNTTRLASVLIVHCGDSEAWSGSAAVAIVAGFLFAQQKRLQVVLPHQEVRTAMALLSASWRSAPSLEDSHRRQLQRFCEEERKRIDQPSAEGGNREVAPGKLKRTGSRNHRADDLTEPWSSSASRRAVDKSTAAAGQQAMKHSQTAQTRNCGSGVAEEDEEKENCAGTKRQEAEDVYLRAAAALHTATLCGLPADAVFILAGDEENRASVFECGTAEGGEAGEEPGEARKSEASKHEKWPLYLLRHLGRISRHVESVVATASASIEEEGEFNLRWTRECLGGGCSVGSSSSDPSTDEGTVGENSAAVAASKSRGQECDDARKKATSELAAAETHDRDHYKVGDTEAGAAGVPVFPALPSQETSEEPARKTYQHYELGAVRLFARLCMDKVGTERGTASTREAIAQPECPRCVDTGATAALKAQRVTGCHLYKLSMQTSKVCTGDTGVLRNASTVSSPAAPERIDLCEAWELTANTVGSVVRTWSPHLGERIATRVCKALRVLLEQLASACSTTLRLTLSTQYNSKDVFARLTTAWGVLVLNVCVLWLRMASVVQENVWPSESERKENTCSSGVSSAAAIESHTLLGETLISTLLQSTLQLAKCLLLSQQYFTSDDAFTVAPEQGFFSGVEGNIEQRHESIPSTAASLGGVRAGFDALQTHPSRGEHSSRCAEGRETWLFGYPTLGLSILLWALYGTFLRPQIAPQLQKKLVKAASLVATVDVPPVGSVPVASSCTVLTQDKVSPASLASRAAVAEAAAAAAVSSIHHILNSEAVQTALLLADVWAAVYPEDVRKLLQEALQGPGETSQGDADACRDSRRTSLPTSLGVVLRPLVFASEEYEGQKR